MLCLDSERLSPSRIEHRNVVRTAWRRHTQSFEPMRNEATFSERAYYDWQALPLCDRDIDPEVE